MNNTPMQTTRKNWQCDPQTLHENTGLVHWAVKKFLGIDKSHPDYEDAVQVGMIALTKAIKGFKPEYGFKLSTYATRGVRRELAYWWRIWNRLGFTAVKDKPMPGRIPIRIPAPLQLERPDGTSDAFDWLCCNDDEPIIDDDPESMQLKEAIAQLSQLEQRIIRDRFWRSQSLVQVANQVGLSRERVRQIEAQAIRQLGRTLGAEYGKA
jgi:RNA polymerase sporulation-specific sigma factor